MSGGRDDGTDLPWQRADGWTQWLYYSDEANSPPATCSGRLAIEQNLVCVADRLAELSDAVGMTVWPALAEAAPDAGVLAYGGAADAGAIVSTDKFLEWDIPPQADADRFILRDLAIHVLGLIPAVDALSDVTLQSPLPAGVSCAEAFAWASNKQNTLLLSCTANSAWTRELFNVGTTATVNGVAGDSYPVLPPSTAPVCDASGSPANVPKIAESALALEAQILRGAGRLLHDLIRRDVYSDLAASAQAAAAPNSPTSGDRAAWGVDLPPGQEPYGTISHAARVLMGRWEIGNINSNPNAFPSAVEDPQCGGVPALGIVSGAADGNTMPSASPPFGADLDARYDDLPIRTPGDQTASQLVDQSGIVVPPCRIPDGSGGAAGLPGGGTVLALRQALAAQLLLQLQTRNLPVGATPAANASAAAVFTKLVSNLADPEVSLAFQRSLRTWRLLTNQPDPDCSAANFSPVTTFGVAGLTIAPASGVAPEVTALSGTVIAGGLPRSRLATDTIARAGGMLQASQCPDGYFGGGTLDPLTATTPDPGWTPWGLGSGASLYLPLNGPGGVPVAPTLPRVVFQDSFHIGQAIERRLAVLDRVALQYSGTPATGALASAASSGADPIARGALAELRTWAGATMVHAWPASTSHMTVLVEGMTPADFGVAPGSLTTTTVRNAFGFVFGPAWVAECAAHARADCPANFDQTYVQAAATVTDLGAGVANVPPLGLTTLQSYGVLSAVGYGAYSLDVPFAAANFRPPVPATLPSSTSHVYMVLLHDPASPLGHGRVMGVLPLAGSVMLTNHPCRTTQFGTLCPPPTRQFTGSIVNFVDAPMQRELLHAALDLGKWVGAAPPMLGDVSVAASSGYCVDGVPRDVFVPLDNELISGTQTYEDSWQHYLDLAGSAAATADTLGQQLIANDLQISQTEQAAAEAFANLCGDFGNLTGATIASNGVVTPNGSDQTATACLSQDTVDVSYLGQTAPTIACSVAGQAGSQSDCFKQVVLQCGKPGVPQSQLCNKGTLTFAHLDLVNASASVGGPGSVTTPTLPGTAACDSLTAATSSLSRGLDGQKFYNGIANSVSANDMSASVQAIKMSVDVFNQWQVTVGGNLLMSSVDTSYWPACLANGCASLPPAAFKAATYLNTAFRWCPNTAGDSPASLLATNLGCNGVGATGQPATVTELNMLKWRVIQGLWMMGVSVGMIPPGMFYTPVPTALELAPTPSTTPVPYFVAQDGVWVGNGSTLTVPSSTEVLHGWQPTPASGNAVIARVGTAYDVASAFSAFDDSAYEIPNWYEQMYLNAAVSGTKNASSGTLGYPNRGWSFDQCLYTAMFKADNSWQSCVVNESSATDVHPLSMASIVSDWGGSLDGIKCTIPDGESSSGFPNGSAAGFNPGRYPLWELVAAAKAGMAGEVTGGTVSLGGTGGSPGALQNLYAGIGCGGSIHIQGGGGAGAPYWSVTGFSCPLWSDQGDTVTGWSTTGSVDSVSMNSSTSATNSGYWFSHYPTASPPSSRVDGVLGSVPPNGTCGAVRLLSQPSAIVCAEKVLLTEPALQGGPPSIATTADIPILASWVSEQQTALNSALANAFVTGLPGTVVAEIESKSVGAGGAAGALGSTYLATEQSVEAIPMALAQISGGLASVSASLNQAQSAINAAGVALQGADLSYALSAASVQAQMVQEENAAQAQIASSIAGIYSSFGLSAGGAIAAISGAASNIQADQNELAIISQQTTNAAQAEAASVSLAIGSLTQSTIPAWTQVQTALDTIQASIATLEENANQARLTQGQAAYQLAIGTGQDFVTVPGGQEVPIPVDTVLRRQASATEQRYQIALTNAKALSYMARRAIEQRIGVPLNALTQSVGPLDAPASWADDICGLQGVNYASLSTAASASQDGGGIGGSLDTQAINQYANGWVGDYVTKLRNLVTYYNVQYPSHQGSDTAVLSLRYDLVAGTGVCVSQGANLLVNSGQLDQTSLAVTGVPGWQDAPCAPWTGKCLSVLAGFDLASPSLGPDGAGNLQPGADGGVAGVTGAGATWLVDVATGIPDGGLGGDAGGGSDAGVLSVAPENSVYQAVSLKPGSYVLSWWDQARDSKGALLTSGAGVSYLVDVFAPSGQQIASAQPSPQVASSASPGLWSARNTLAFTVSQGGTYTVAFAASDPSSGVPGSVAIADVQLELSPSGVPSPYVPTSSTTAVTAFNCPISDADLRASFIHACDASGNCWYDLNAPLIIDTAALNAGTSSLGAKLAAGNYNYRNIDVAVNLVGTSVHTCVNDPNPNCYGSGYLQYDLNHDATHAGIIGFDANERFFNFGVGSIHHGKALAAERYLTMPLASADQQLVTQPGIQHIELSGRPLDGSYSLRIWDSPDLNWSALQDIQIVFDYEYWSSIVANGNQQGHAPPRPHGVRATPIIRTGNPRRHL